MLLLMFERDYPKEWWSDVGAGKQTINHHQSSVVRKCMPKKYLRRWARDSSSTTNTNSHKARSIIRLLWFVGPAGSEREGIVRKSSQKKTNDPNLRRRKQTALACSLCLLGRASSPVKVQCWEEQKQRLKKANERGTFEKQTVDVW